MKHFHRTQLHPEDVLTIADGYFTALGMTATATAPRERGFAGPLGRLTLSARPEGGHYTFVEAHTDQVGESRMDKNVKKFFLRLHKTVDPRHQLDAAY